MMIAHAKEITPSEALKSFRRYHKLTQRQLAVMLHVPLTTLQGWEQGRKMAYPRMLDMALRFGDWLLEQ